MMSAKEANKISSRNHRVLHGTKYTNWIQFLQREHDLRISEMSIRIKLATEDAKFHAVLQFKPTFPSRNERVDYLTLLEHHAELENKIQKTLEKRGYRVQWHRNTPAELLRGERVACVVYWNKKDQPVPEYKPTTTRNTPLFSQQYLQNIRSDMARQHTQAAHDAARPVTRSSSPSDSGTETEEEEEEKETQSTGGGKKQECLIL